jgi:hypothetical protein
MGYMTMHSDPQAAAMGPDRDGRIAVFGAMGHTRRFVVAELRLEALSRQRISVEIKG